MDGAPRVFLDGTGEIGVVQGLDEVVHVAAGAERTTGSRQNGDFGLGILGQRAKQLGVGEQHLGRRCIEVVRPVEGDDAQTAFGNYLDVIG
ncbi:hypothetical protein D3C86_1718670 [compost metagenome]